MAVEARDVQLTVMFVGNIDPQEAVGAAVGRVQVEIVVLPEEAEGPQ
jgi:hypothetical protein